MRANRNYTHHHQKRGDGQATKMLASTMQISNNNPTNTLNHTCGLEQREEQKPNHTHPRRGRPTRGQDVRLIPQDPTVCLTPSPTNAGP